MRSRYRASLGMERTERHHDSGTPHTVMTIFPWACPSSMYRKASAISLQERLHRLNECLPTASKMTSFVLPFFVKSSRDPESSLTTEIQNLR